MGSNLLKVESTEGMRIGDRVEVRTTAGTFFSYIAGFGSIILTQGVPFAVSAGTPINVSDSGRGAVPPIFGMGRGQATDGRNGTDANQDGAERIGTDTLGPSAARSPTDEDVTTKTNEFLRISAATKAPDVPEPLPKAQKEITDWHLRLKKNVLQVSDRADEKEMMWLDEVLKANSEADNFNFDIVPQDCIRMNRLLVPIFDKKFKLHSVGVKLRIDYYEKRPHTQNSGLITAQRLLATFYASFLTSSSVMEVVNITHLGALDYME